MINHDFDPLYRKQRLEIERLQAEIEGWVDRHNEIMEERNRYADALAFYANSRDIYKADGAWLLAEKALMEDIENGQ